MSRSWMATGLAALLAVLPATGALAAESGNKNIVSIPVIPVPQSPPPASNNAGSGVVTIPVLPDPQSPPPSTTPGGGKTLPGAPGSGTVTLPVIPTPQSPPPAPSGNGAPGTPSGGTVTIPVIRGPEDQGAPPAVQKLPAPVMLMGSQLVLLFGRLEQTGGQYYIVSQRANGQVRYEVTGDQVTLAGLAGKQIGATATKEVVNATVRYHIQSALVLTEDLGTKLISNGGLIYVAPPGQISVLLRGRLVQMDQLPIIGNGRTLVPVRAITEALGAQVTWDQPTRTVHITLDDRQVAVTIGSNVAVVQRGTEVQEVETDIAPILVNNRTLVPARLIAESLGLQVNWNDTSRTVEIQ